VRLIYNDITWLSRNIALIISPSFTFYYNVFSGHWRLGTNYEDSWLRTVKPFIGIDHQVEDFNYYEDLLSITEYKKSELIQEYTKCQ